MPHSITDRCNAMILNSEHSAHLLNSQSFIEALAHLEQIAEGLCVLKNKQEPKSAFAEWGIGLDKLEKISQVDDQRPWRYVFDAPMSEGQYINNPIIQLCSGAPAYDRILFEFTSDGVQINFDNTSVTADPDLTKIKCGQDRLTLDERRQQDEQKNIQRIAILGAARIFIHGDKPNPAHIELTKRVEIQLNRFFDVFEHANSHHHLNIRHEPRTRFRTVNGGWAGKEEGSTGLPAICKMFGEVADQTMARKPVTVMPSGGAYDRVEGVYAHNYYEVPGTWGDDSKYLIGYSSAALIFEPYGFWTEIELRNAVAQGKPTAVITQNMEQTCERLKIEWTDEDKRHAPNYKEASVLLPNKSIGYYRIYQDAALAAVWMKRCANVKFIDTFQGNNVELTEETHQQLNVLKQRYKSAPAVDSINFKELVKQCKVLLGKNDRHDFMVELNNQHGWSNQQDLIEQLKSYRANRERSDKSYYHFGIFKLFKTNCFSKDQKITAVDALIAYLEGKSLDGNRAPVFPGKEAHVGALYQGALGKIIANWERDTQSKIHQLNIEVPLIETIVQGNGSEGFYSQYVQ